MARPRLNPQEKSVRATFTMGTEDYAHLVKLGNGNASAGLRRAIVYAKSFQQIMKEKK